MPLKRYSKELFLYLVVRFAFNKIVFDDDFVVLVI